MTEDQDEPEGTGENELDIDEIELENIEDLKEMDLVGDVKAGQQDYATASPVQAPSPLAEPPDISDHAAKVYSMELVSGEFVQGAGSTRSYLRMWNGEDIDKARLMGTLVQKFISNDQTYCTLTLDDGTETIRIKGWREDVTKLSPFEVGQIVDVIGNIREYDGEVYILPISINEISDPNWEPLRELEIYKLRKVKKNDLQL